MFIKIACVLCSIFLLMIRVPFTTIMSGCNKFIAFKHASSFTELTLCVFSLLKSPLFNRYLFIKYALRVFDLLFNKGTASVENKTCPITRNKPIFFIRFLASSFLLIGCSRITASIPTVSSNALYTQRDDSQSEASKIIFFCCM